MYMNCVLLCIAINIYGVLSALSKTCLAYLYEVLNKYSELYIKFFSL